MTKLPEGKSRLDLVREGRAGGGIDKRGRLLVNIHKLLEDPNNERKTFRNMAGLMASIKQLGLIEPITVTPDGKDTYRIITGHRRYRAAREAGLQTVEVLIRDPEDEKNRRVKSIVSNVQREDVGPVEMAEALQSLLDEDDRIKSQRELARVIGKDETWVSRMLRILDLPVNLQKKLATSQVSVPYDAVAAIARLPDASNQEELVDALAHGATNRDIREKINAQKDSPRKSGSPKPKHVYYTTQRATVIVQSLSSTLNGERTISALEEALKQARKQS